MGYFEIGKIVNTQGVRGDVRVVPFTDDSTRFELLDTVTVVLRGNEQELEIEKVWYHKQFVVLKFKGIDNMNAAEILKNALLKIPEDKALPLGENEYYIRDLYGIKVVSAEEELGIIADIIFTGANDVYVVKNSRTGEEILIPAIKQCILSVDIKNGIMNVLLPEGLRD